MKRCEQQSSCWTVLWQGVVPQVWPLWSWDTQNTQTLNLRVMRAAVCWLYSSRTVSWRSLVSAFEHNWLSDWMPSDPARVVAMYNHVLLQW
jgi:hypothetical protein